jgi:hypothetical protein
MSRFKFLPFLFFLLNFSNITYAATSSEVCFRILWQSSSGVGPIAKQREGKQDFINLNNLTNVSFVYDSNKAASFDSNGKPIASWSYGCINAGAFSLGNNSITMNFHMFSDYGFTAITEGYLKVAVAMELPSGSSRQIIEKIFQADPSKFSWSIPETYHANLADLSPELAALVEKKKQSIKDNMPAVQKESSSYDEELKKYDAIMEGFANKSFLELTEDELLAYQEARERFIFNKSRVEERAKSIAQKTSDLRLATESARAQIQNAINAEGFDIKSEDLLQFDNPYQVPAFASVPMTENGDQFPYDDWANQAIQELQFQLDSGHRVAFLTKALHWQSQMDSLLAIVESRAALSKEEFNAFEAAGNKVNAYLFGNGADQKGVLTEDFWFKDLNIDPELRASIDNDLARYNPEQAKRIKAAINKFDKDIRLIIEHIKAASALAQMYRNASNSKETSLVDDLTQGLAAALEKAPEVISCIAKTSAAGPYADFYEFYYEENFCTGEPNDQIDQAIAGVSLVAEAGGLVFSGPVGSWVVDKAEAGIKFSKKMFAAVKTAKAERMAAKLESVNHMMASAIKSKEGRSFKEVAEASKKSPLDVQDLREASNAADYTKLKTELKFKEDGIMTHDGFLSERALSESKAITQGAVLKNEKVIKELTKDGSKIEDWAKYTTTSSVTSSGQRLQIHYYMNKLTGRPNYNIDFKVKGVIDL